jgi:high-affinity Fe2+/Pb2+ permease
MKHAFALIPAKMIAGFLVFWLFYGLGGQEFSLSLNIAIAGAVAGLVVALVQQGARNNNKLT